MIECLIHGGVCASATERRMASVAAMHSSAGTAINPSVTRGDTPAAMIQPRQRPQHRADAGHGARPSQIRWPGSAVDKRSPPGR